MRALPNSTEASLGRAIEALGGERFEVTLYQWLARCYEIDNTTMLAYFQNRAPEVLFTQSMQPRVHDQIFSTYLAGAYLVDPFYTLHLERAPAGLYRMQDIAPDHFQRNEYYATYYRATTLVDEIAYVAYPAEGVSVHICLGRDAASGRRFSPRDLAEAERITPIVCGLIAQNWASLKSGGDFNDEALLDVLIAELRAVHDIALSPRQAQIALMILRGHSSVSIALRLEISAQTVKVFRKQLYRKCAISSQAELFSLVMPLLSQKLA